MNVNIHCFRRLSGGLLVAVCFLCTCVELLVIVFVNRKRDPCKRIFGRATLTIDRNDNILGLM